jgi:hypothetical protein
MNPLSSEPSVTIGTFLAAIGAGIVLLREFGVGITLGQERALLAFCTIALPLIAGFVIRGFVYAKDTTQDVASEAHAAGQAGAPVPEVHV